MTETVLTYDRFMDLPGKRAVVARLGISRRPVYEVDGEWWEDVYDIKFWFSKFVKCSPERRAEIESNPANFVDL